MAKGRRGKPVSYWQQLGMSTRSRNVLVNADIHDLDDLKKTTCQDLLRLPNFGHGSLTEVQQLTGWPPTIELMRGDPAHFVSAETLFAALCPEDNASLAKPVPVTEVSVALLLLCHAYLQIPSNVAINQTERDNISKIRHELLLVIRRASAPQSTG